MALAFRWTPQRERALALDWQGQHAHQIAAAVGVTTRTVEGWRRRPAWRARRAQIHEAYQRQLDAEFRQRWGIPFPG